MQVIKTIDFCNIDLKRIDKICDLPFVPRHMKRVDIAVSVSKKFVVYRCHN